MEDIFKFLLVIGIIAVGFVRQAKQEANKKTGGSPVMPMPDEDSPFPETIITPQKKTKKTEKKHTPIQRQPQSHQNTDNAFPEQADASSEFEIHSVEEARKAIIWGEILQRKY